MLFMAISSLWNHFTYEHFSNALAFLLLHWQIHKQKKNGEQSHEALRNRRLRPFIVRTEHTRAETL